MTAETPHTFVPGRERTSIPGGRPLLAWLSEATSNPPVLLALFLVAIGLVFSALRSDFATTSNAVTIAADAAVLAMISLGQTFVLISGGFDLSVSGVAPLAAVAFTLLSNGGVPATGAIVLVMAIGAAVGTLNGSIITWIGINPLITTLGMLSVTGGAAYAISAGVTVALNNPAAGYLNDALPGNLPVFVVLTIALAVVGDLLLRFTVLGRRIYAMGGNRNAAWLAGVRVDVLTVAAYALCGALAALAGIMVASELLAGSGTVEASAALDSITAVVLGGAALTGGEGSVVGTMLGVLIIGVIGNGLELLHISAFYQQIATGVILLLAVGVQRLKHLTGQPPGNEEPPPDPDLARNA